ncbi:hypothetical protein FKP32DRAFT_1478662 [Trametes sanguinea]|nr:hypothetical protein FKP32DRAFT_1478662 [Trametes sanguinea]
MRQQQAESQERPTSTHPVVRQANMGRHSTATSRLARDRHGAILAPLSVEPLECMEIPRAVETTQDAMRNDSMARYFNDVDTVPGRRWRGRTSLVMNYTDAILRHRAWTINHGEALLTLQGPLLPIFTPLLKATDTEELTKRKAEFRDKLARMLHAAFGDHVDKLIEVQGLVTAPAKQGHGFGTALIEFANALVCDCCLSDRLAYTRLTLCQADAQDRGVYILTTDAYRFYETVGYTLVEEDVLGVDNPKWKGDPVHIRIMYRGPGTGVDGSAYS